MCPLGGEIAHYLWATFHLHSWLLWEPLWLWWKSHKPLLGNSTALTADTLMDSFVIGKEGNDSELAVALFDGVWRSASQTWQMEQGSFSVWNQQLRLLERWTWADIVSNSHIPPWCFLLFSFDERFSRCIVRINLCYPQNMEVIKEYISLRW